MARRLTDEEREARRKAKEEEKARKAREREEKKAAKQAAKEAEKSKKRRGMPSWLYWLTREQAAKKREHEQFLNAGRTALALARAIRSIQQKIMGIIGPVLNFVAGLKTPEARLAWSREPWTPQERNRYNWGKKKELAELWAKYPRGIAVQDTKKAAADARRKTAARRVDHAKAIDRVLDTVVAELAESERNAITSSLERSYRQVAADIAREIEAERRAIDADEDGETRTADARDYTKAGKPRRTAPETQIPRNMPRFGNYGESVVFGAPSPDQVKAALNAEFEGKDYSKRLWGDTEKLAQELKEAVRSSIINGEGDRETARKFAQRMGVHFSHALRLIRTETSRIVNEATLDRYRQAGVKYYKWVAIHDGRTCGKCLKKDGKLFPIADKRIGVNFPPLHPHCRCTIIRGEEPNGKHWLDRLLEQWEAGTLPDELNKLAEGIEQTGKAPTQAEAEAAATRQEAADKAEEEKLQEALGRQKKAIEQGKKSKRGIEASMTIKPHAEEKTKRVRPENIPTEANFDNSKRFGMKAGEHMRELGLSPGDPTDRQKYKDMINKTIKEAERIKRGYYTKQEQDVLCFQKKDIVVLTRTNGEIITAYTTATDRKDRPRLEERAWYMGMETLFDVFE